MFENFSTIDFILLGALVLLNIVFIVFIILLSKKRGQSSVLDKNEELKVTKIDSKETENSAFDEIMEAMKKDVNSKKENAVEIFEQEQEEKAIISYQELLKIQKKEPIEEEQEVEQKQTKTKAVPKLVTTKSGKFTKSEFVSPVFGKVEKNDNTDIEIEVDKEVDTHELERSLNIEPLAEEIKKNNEFLNALKEFRKNL